MPIRPDHGPQVGTHAYNTALLFDPSGECSARYDKIHLFSFSQGTEQHAEGDTMVGGDSVGTAHGPFGNTEYSSSSSCTAGDGVRNRCKWKQPLLPN